jgi:hypothetical protein
MDDYANFNGLKSICLTIDVDFAPEYMIKNIVDIIDEYDVNATFFATHNSGVLHDLEFEGKYEIGIHPNLSNNSTQGAGVDEIVCNLKKEYPSSISNRFHKLDYQYSDFSVLKKNGFQSDVSRLLYNSSYVLPSYQSDTNLVLLTYIWEDGICENAGFPMDISGIDLHSPGVKIINFHPLNVYLNVSTMYKRLNFLNTINNSNLTCCPESHAEKYRYDGPGSYNVLKQLLSYARDSKITLRTINELSEAYLNEIERGA